MDLHGASPGSQKSPTSGLARYFNTSPRFWLNLQAACEREIAEDELARKMERGVRPASVAPANLRRFSKANVPLLFFCKKSFATFSAAMHSDAQRCTAMHRHFC
jgi:hypothetical protein